VVTARGGVAVRTSTRQLLNVFATIIVLAVNALANVLPINGLNTGEISDRFPVLFVPAGYVFAIWGLIYVGLIAFSVYQALPSQRDNPRLARIDYIYVASCAANSTWILFWHYLVFPATIVLMLVLLACLISIYLRLGIGRPRPSLGERWAVQIPFSIYLGWITVAMIANATDVLWHAGWRGGGIPQPVWAAVMVAAAAVVAGLMALTRRDVPYLGVIVWSLVGIAIKQSATTAVAVAAWLFAAIVLAMLVVIALRRDASLTSLGSEIPS
jgi:translocator protein